MLCEVLSEFPTTCTALVPLRVMSESGWRHCDFVNSLLIRQYCSGIPVYVYVWTLWTQTYPVLRRESCPLQLLGLLNWIIFSLYQQHICWFLLQVSSFLLSRLWFLGMWNVRLEILLNYNPYRSTERMFLLKFVSFCLSTLYDDPDIGFRQDELTVMLSPFCLHTDADIVRLLRKFW